MQKQDGGEDDLFKLLDTITIESATHSVDFQLADYATYDYFVVKFTTTLTESNWIYLRINGSRTPKYSDPGKNYSDVTIALVRSGKTAAYCVTMAYSTTPGNVTYLATSKPSSIGFEVYKAEANFETGSIFKLYGSKLPE